MNLVRSVISFFMLVVLVVAVAGFVWAGGLPSPKMEWARVALVSCGLMAVGSIHLLWKPSGSAQE